MHAEITIPEEEFRLTDNLPHFVVKKKKGKISSFARYLQIVNLMCTLSIVV